MYVLKVIRIFLSLLEICYVYPNIQNKSQEPAHEKAWVDFTLCAALEDVHMQRSDTTKNTSKLFLTVPLYQKYEVSINLKGKVSMRSPSAGETKCSTEQKLPKFPVHPRVEAPFIP